MSVLGKSAARAIDALRLDLRLVRDTLSRTRPPLLLHALESPIGFVDTDGRPLREPFASPEEQAAAPTEYKPCSYPDSRYGHPINVTALEHLGGHWPDVLGGIRFLRHSYVERHGQRDATPGDFLAVTCAALALPGYLGYRREQPVDHGRMPAAIANIAKVAAGTVVTARGAVAGFASDRALSPQLVYDFAKTRRDLHGDGEVCAAPPRLLLEALAAFLGTDQGPATDLSGILGDASEYLDATSYVEDLALLLLASEIADRATLIGLRPFLAEFAARVANPFLDRAPQGDPITVLSLCHYLNRQGVCRVEEALSPTAKIDAGLIQELSEAVVADAEQGGPVSSIDQARPLVTWLLRHVALRARMLELVQELEMGLCHAMGRPAARPHLDWIDARYFLSSAATEVLETALSARLDVTPTGTSLRLGVETYRW